MFGNHLEENCWTIHPEKKPNFGTPRKGRGRERGRSRSKSKEPEETRTKKKGRENSPYPSKVGRVMDKQFTDRDSDGSSDKESSVKDLERDYLEAKEKYEKQARRAQ